MFEISAGGGSGKPSFSGKEGKFPDKSIPPAGTSARKAYEKTMREGTGKPNTTVERWTGTFDYPAKSIFGFSPDASNPSPYRKRSSGGSSGGSSHTSARKSWDYYEAPLAEKYGFGKATAYQEALANTSYRREMEDMRRAGLNPSVIYGSHSSSGADSNIYPREGSSGGSGGSGGSGRRYRGGNSGKYVFSGGAYYGAMFAAGTVAAIATHNAGVGMAVAGLTGTALKAINGFLKK